MVESIENSAMATETSPKMIEITALRADLSLPQHQEAIVSMLDAYMRDPMGDQRPFDRSKRDALITGLQNMPTTRVYLAYTQGHLAGMVIGFVGFSTFVAKPLFNLHDVVVLDEFRGLGVGRRLMEAVIADARSEGCCKLTLEVRRDNLVARSLYRRMGFHDQNPAMNFWVKEI